MDKLNTILNVGVFVLVAVGVAVGVAKLSLEITPLVGFTFALFVGIILFALKESF